MIQGKLLYNFNIYAEFYYKNLYSTNIFHIKNGPRTLLVVNIYITHMNGYMKKRFRVNDVNHDAINKLQAKW